jgi:hypothetical protein
MNTIFFSFSKTRRVALYPFKGVDIEVKNVLINLLCDLSELLLAFMMRESTYSIVPVLVTLGHLRSILIRDGDDFCKEFRVAPNHRMALWTREFSNKQTMMNDIPNQLSQPNEGEKKHCNTNVS